MTAPTADVLAAVDIGTNSVHMVVARVDHEGRIEVLAREKEMVRLGRSGGDMKELAPDAIDRGVAALQRCKRVAEAHGAALAAVATSAVREAENRRVFLDRALEEAGVVVEVISGFEEARLIHLGVLQALSVYDQRVLLCDIGGGSTEVLLGQRGEALASRSFRLGAIRLTERFLARPEVRARDVERCRQH
ncbi:MAG: exopolyphosphatase, partial [Bacillota bacterium]